MSSKRTFGLVGDYGGDSSDDESGAVNENKDSAADPECLGYLVVKKSKVSTDNTESEDSTEVSIGSKDSTSSKETVLRSKWEGVRTEYEDSSLMYKYTQDLAEDDEETFKNKKVTESDSSIDAASKALAEADNVLKGVNDKTNVADDGSVEQSEYVKQLVAEQQRREKEMKEREQAALDWEIQEIQKEIEEERKRWDGVYSDEEGEGAETEAIFQDQKRRNDVLQAVLDEVQKKNKSAEEGDSKLDKYTKKGEGWKRLQLIAQSRVNTDPDKVNQYPSHKFPLRDK